MSPPNRQVYQEAHRKQQSASDSDSNSTSLWQLGVGAAVALGLGYFMTSYKKSEVEYERFKGNSTEFGAYMGKSKK